MFERFDDAFLREYLLPVQDFTPWPRYEDREAWESLPAPVREEMIRRGEGWLNYEWPSLLATGYMEFLRNGNRNRYEKLYFERRIAIIDMMIAECIEGKGRFLDQLANGAWLVCEETSWTIPAHDCHDNFIPDPLPDPEDSPRDLFGCETGAMMASLYYFLGDKFSELSQRLALRIREETLRRIVRPAMRSYSWWMGIENLRGSRHTTVVNNWAPWCASTTLLAALLLGETDGARRKYVRQMLDTLEIFAEIYGEDGGCDEGPAYWGRAAAAFYEALSLLKDASGGGLDVFDLPKVQAMGLYLPKMHIAGNWYVNFADCAASLLPTADLVYRYGRSTSCQRMMDFASWLAHRNGSFSHSYCVIPALHQIFTWKEMMDGTGNAVGERLEYFPDIEVMVAREGKFMLAAKGGHNGESHNHNDIGSFVLYHGGEPAFIDAGTLTYSRKTFSEQRYEIWTMQSSYHNLPDFGGREQLPGESFRSGGVELIGSKDGCCFAVNVEPAWDGCVEKYRRHMILNERGLRLEERYVLTDSVPVTFHFMLAEKPEILADGWRIGCKGGDLKLTLSDAGTAAVSVDEIHPEDQNMNTAWGRETLYRLNITLAEKNRGEAKWNICSMED